MAGIRKSQVQAKFSYVINGFEVQTDVVLNEHNRKLLLGELDPRKPQTSQFEEPWTSWKAHVVNANEFYYCQGLGLWHYSNWKELLGERILSCKITVTQWMIENKQPASFKRWLMLWDEPREFFTSRAYTATVGKSIGSGQTFGKQLCTPRGSSRSRAVSTCRVDKLCSEYNLTLLEPYVGDRVRVSAHATGNGLSRIGIVDAIYPDLGTTLVSISFIVDINI